MGPGAGSRAPQQHALPFQNRLLAPELSGWPAPLSFPFHRRRRLLRALARLSGSVLADFRPNLAKRLEACAGARRGRVCPSRSGEGRPTSLAVSAAGRPERGLLQGAP